MQHAFTRVIALYFDISGFTAAVEQSSDVLEHAPFALERIHSAVFDGLQSLQAPMAVLPLGDGALFLFERPSDDGVAEELLDALAGAAAHLAQTSPAIVNGPSVRRRVSRFPDRLRFAIDSGPCWRFETKAGRTHYFGRALNSAARLLDFARPEGVVLNQAAGELPGLRGRGFYADEVCVRSYSSPIAIWRFTPVRPTQAAGFGRADHRLTDGQWSTWGRVRIPLVRLLAADIEREESRFRVQQHVWRDRDHFRAALRLPDELQPLYRRAAARAEAQGQQLRRRVVNGARVRLCAAPADEIVSEDERLIVSLSFQPCYYFDFLALSRSLDCMLPDEMTVRTRYRDQAQALGGFVGVAFLYLTKDNRLVFVDRQSNMAVAAGMRHVSIAEGMRVVECDEANSDQDPVDTACRGVLEELVRLPGQVGDVRRTDWLPLRSTVRVLQAYFDWELWQYLFVGYIRGAATFDQVRASIESRIGHTGLEHDGVSSVLWNDATDSESLTDNARRVLAFVSQSCSDVMWSTHALACLFSFLECHYWRVHGAEGGERLKRQFDEVFGRGEDLFYALSPREPQNFACSSPLDA